MLRHAPICPECASRNTRWLPATSDVGIVDYFQCDSCRTVGVVDPADTDVVDGHAVTPPRRGSLRSGRMFLFVDLEAGLLFASMAQATHDHERRFQLRRKAQTALDAVTRFLPRVEMSDDSRTAVSDGLETLKHEIAKIPAT